MPPMSSTFKDFFQKQIEKYPWLGIFGIFLCSRLVVLAGLLLSRQKSAVEGALAAARLLFNTSALSGGPFAIHPFALRPDYHGFTDFAKYWDGLWYLNIALHGYQYDGTTQHQSVTFYPFYPWLAKTLAAPLMLLGVSSESAILISGVILSNGLFLAALVMQFALIRKKSGQKVAWLTVALLSFYPGSLFCSLFLTEGCFLALAVGFFLALERRQYVLATLLCWPACLTRFNGLALAVSGLAKAGVGNLLKKPYVWFLPCLCLGPLLYPLYIAWGFGDPLLYLKMHANYRGQLPVLKLSALLLMLGMIWLLYSNDASVRLKRNPAVARLARWGLYALGVCLAVFYIASLLNLSGVPGIWSVTQNLLPAHLGPVVLATSLGLVAFALYQHQLEPAYKTYTILNLFPLLFSGTFFSNHRYLTLIFPLFWGVALGLEKFPRQGILLCGCFALLLLGLTILYAGLGWLMVF
jgi:hypothetical protein